MKHVVILGAGAAGLSAAWELAGAGDVQVTVVESADRAGGIACCESLGANQIDVGGHRFFSKRPEAVALMRSMGERDDLWLNRKRAQRIYYRRKFLDYPISLNRRLIRSLGVAEVIRFGFSWLHSQLMPMPEDSLENFYINRFGRRLYDCFFRSYTQKVCGAEPGKISPDWGRDRVRGLSVRSILMPKSAGPVRGAMAPDEFLYPRRGPSQLWNSVAEQLRSQGVELLLNTRATGFDRASDGRITAVKAQQGSTEVRIPADFCITTLPVRDTVRMLADAPAQISRIADGLTSRGFLTAAVLLPRSAVRCSCTDCWVYVQEADVKMGRFQIYNNWSPEMVEHPEENILLGFEYFADPGDEIWELPEQELCALAVEEAKRLDILREDAAVLGMKRCVIVNAYPTYGGTYPQRDQVMHWLAQIDNLSSAGRQGLHSYINLDDAMLSGIAAAGKAMAFLDR